MDSNSRGDKLIPFLSILHNKPGETLITELRTYINSVEVGLTSEAKKNSLTITLYNKHNQLDILNFELGDNITFYMDTTAISTQDPMISTEIISVDYDLDNKKKQIKIKCQDKTASLLSKVFPNAYTNSDGKKAYEIIQDIIEFTNFYGDKKMTTTNVATTQHDGSAFTQVVEISKIFKPLYEWIDELSTPGNTGEDRTYVYFVDSSNDLHWHYPYQKEDIYLDGGINSSVTTINVDSTSTYPDSGIIQIDSEQISYTGKTSTSFTGCTRGYGLTIATSHTDGTQVSPQIVREGVDDCLSISITKSDENNYNFIVYNAGPTPEGFEYLWYKFDEANTGKDFKMTKQDFKDIGNDMRAEEYNKDSSKWDSPEVSNNKSSKLYPNAYPWTTSWGIVTTNDGEYYDAFIAEMVSRGEERCNTIFSKTGKAKYKASVEMYGNLKYNINEICTIISPTHNITKKLRVKEIRHQVGKNGWNTSLTLQEDEDALSID